MNTPNWIKGILLASRVPNLLIIGVTQYCSAYMLTRHGLMDDIGLHVYLLILSTMLVAAGGYIINDYYDLKIDMVNRPDRVVVGRELSRRKALLTHTLISLLAVLMGLYISWQVALLHTFSVTVLWYYSNYLRRIFIGKAVIAMLTAISILMVGLAFGVVSYRLMAFAAFGAVIVWIREIIKDMENAPGESAFGVESVPSVWGYRGAKTFIMIIATIGCLLLAYFIYKVQSPIFTYYYLSLIPFLIGFGLLLTGSDRRQHYRRLRHFTNLLILAGVLSMLFV
jgi:4-hydroxybenzoate polyprenyltransferase